MTELSQAKRLARDFVRRKRIEFCKKDLERINSLEQQGRQIKAGVRFFRSVPWETSPKQVSLLSYPPAQYVNRMGRCNDVGQSVLYVTTEPSAVFAEQKGLQVGATFAIGEWAVINEMWALQIGFPPGHLYNPHATAKQFSPASLHLDRMFQQCFRTRGSSRYPQTISIFDYVTATGMRVGGDKVIKHGILYPSVDHPNPGACAVNFACAPHVADEYLKLIHADFVRVDAIDGRTVKFTVLETAQHIEDDGSIIWKQPFTLSEQDALDAKEIVITSPTAKPYAVLHSGEQVEMEPKTGTIDFFTNHPDYIAKR